MKQKLVENFSKDWNEPLYIKKLGLNESAKIIEAEGKKFNVNEGYEVPVWRLGKKNLNNRVYSRSLGESVIKEYGGLVTVNLADHPEGDSDGSVKDILGISKNPHIKDDILYVDSYPVDEAFGKKLARMVELGAGLGVSSSCYGDVDSNGNVIEEDFEVVRWFDYVISPSYEVFVTQESFKENIKENLTIKSIKEQKNMPEDKVSELLEKTTRLNIIKLVEEAEKIEKISEKISAIEEAVSYTSENFLPDLKESLTEKLTKLREESFELAEKGKQVDELNESLKLKESEKEPLLEKVSALEEEKKTLLEKIETMEKIVEDLQEHSKKAEQLLEAADAEVGSRFTAREFLEAVERANEAEEACSKTEEEKKELEDEKEEIEESLKNLKYENKQLNERILKLRKKVKTLTETVNAYEQEVEDGSVNEDDIDMYNTEVEADFDYDNYLEPEISNVEDELELDIQDDQIEDYYDDLVAEEPRYESFKNVICSCKTMMEAQRTAMRLKSAIDKMPTSNRKKIVKESINEGADLSKIIPKGWV